MAVRPLRGSQCSGPDGLPSPEAGCLWSLVGVGWVGEKQTLEECEVVVVTSCFCDIERTSARLGSALLEAAALDGSSWASLALFIATAAVPGGTWLLPGRVQLLEWLHLGLHHQGWLLMKST